MTDTAGRSGARPFNVARLDVDEIAVVAVEGEVDVYTAPEVEDALRSISDASAVVVDLCETTFMDSSGLRLLLTTAREMPDHLHVACIPDGPVRRLFELSNLHTTLKLHPTREEAVTAARGG